MPQTWTDAVARAEELTKRRDHKGARDLLRAAIPEKANAPIWFRIVLAELACGDLDGAQAALDDARLVGLGPGSDLQLTTTIGVRRAAYTDVMAAAHRATAAGITFNHVSQLNITTAALETGDYGLAETLADAVLEAYPDHQQAVEMLYFAVLCQLDDESIEDVLERRMFAPGNGPVHLFALQKLRAMKMLNEERMQRLLQRARARWAGHPDLDRYLSKCLPPRFADLPVQEGQRRMDTIKARLNQIVAVTPVYSDVAKRVLSDIDEDMLTRDPVISAVTEPVAMSENTGTGHVVVYFHGMAEVAVMTVAMDAYFNCAGANAIYLRDPERVLFCTGHADLGSDIDGTAAALQKKIDSYGPRKSLTMVGVSAGGFGAVVFGTRLKADRILCFSSSFYFDRAFFDSIGERRARAILHRIESYVPAEQRRCRHLLEAMDPPIRLDLIYGAAHKQDAAHAEVLRGAPGVTLYPLKGVAQHAAVTELMVQGHFMDLVRGNMRRIAALCDPALMG